MECPVCGRTCVTINKVDKYCQIHYEMWYSLWNIFLAVYKTYGALSWKDFLLKIIQANPEHPSNPSDPLGSVGNIELREYLKNEELAEERQKFIQPIEITPQETTLVQLSFPGHSEQRCFNPEQIFVSTGATVTWQIIDGPHLIFFKEKDRLFMSPILGGEDKSFKHTFNEKGVFDFRCHMHYPWVAGKVIVH